MDEIFLMHVGALRASLEKLLAAHAWAPSSLPTEAFCPGVYVISDGSKHLYVGRSNNIRRRIRRHCRAGATERMASFAFRMARESTGRVVASYRQETSRSALLKDPLFGPAFETAKQRIGRMQVRFVEERDPVRQCLLEIYVAVTLATPYNDFDNH